MEIPSFYLENVDGPFIFDCNNNLFVLNLGNMPAFYIDNLKAWIEVQRLCKADLHQDNIRSSILWNSKKYYNRRKINILEGVAYSARIDRVKDLLDENNSFLGYHQFCRSWS